MLLKKSWDSYCHLLTIKYYFSRIQQSNQKIFQMSFIISQEAWVQYRLKLMERLSSNILIFKNHNCNNFSFKPLKNKWKQKCKMLLMTFLLLPKAFLMTIKDKLFSKIFKSSSKISYLVYLTNLLINTSKLCSVANTMRHYTAYNCSKMII